MGTLWAIVCETCNIKRNLDKMHIGPMWDAENVDEYIERRDSFDFIRPVLLASFMVEHYGHDCFLIDDDRDWDIFRAYPEEDRDFWG